MRSVESPSMASPRSSSYFIVREAAISHDSRVESPVSGFSSRGSRKTNIGQGGFTHTRQSICRFLIFLLRRFCWRIYSVHATPCFRQPPNGRIIQMQLDRVGGKIGNTLFPKVPPGTAKRRLGFVEVAGAVCSALIFLELPFPVHGVKQNACTPCDPFSCRNDVIRPSRAYGSFVFKRVPELPYRKAYPDFEPSTSEPG